jgi:poly(hydroxyalkanoate) granule-associated protein
MASKLKLGPKLRKGATKAAGQGAAKVMESVTQAMEGALGKSVVDSAQSIWLAGLGAFSKAQGEGGKVFEVLVEQGKKLQQGAKDVTDQAMKTVRGTAASTVEGAVNKAQGQWDKLEQVFEERVSRSLNRIGVITNKDLEDLTKQVASLSDAVRKLTVEKPANKAKPAAKSAKAPVKKAAAKKVAKKVVPKTAVEKVAAAANQMAKSVAKQPAVKRAKKLVKNLTK